MSADSKYEYEESVSSIHNRLFFRVFQAGNNLERQAIREIGITPVQWSVLGALSRPQLTDGMLFSELTDYLLVSRQSLDGVIKRLEREEYVERVMDSVDRRSKRVVMTEIGREFWESLQIKIYEFYRQALEGFRFDDKVSFVHYLNLINDGMKGVNLENANSTEGDSG
jgi:DNA-binding MarR family transcriptional regulator